MKAIILAAGRGMRLNSGDRSAIPKSMEDINGISILHYQIKNCLICGIKKFVIVVGYQKVLLMAHALELLDEQQVVFVENEIFERTNTLYSLYLTQRYMCEDFIYFNADVLFHPRLLKMLITGEDSSLLLIEKKQTGEEEVKVRVVDDLIVEIHKQIDPAEATGEFIGIAKFISADLPCFIECLEFGVANGHENNYFEFAVNMMCIDRELKPIFTNGLPCIEIDFPDDLKKAKDVLFANIGGLS
jgi:choline kinase